MTYTNMQLFHESVQIWWKIMNNNVCPRKIYFPWTKNICKTKNTKQIQFHVNKKKTKYEKRMESNAFEIFSSHNQRSSNHYHTKASNNSHNSSSHSSSRINKRKFDILSRCSITIRQQWAQIQTVVKKNYHFKKATQSR